MADETPQLDDGYIRIANELFRAIVRADFSKRELKVVLAVLERTYGWGKKFDDVTMTQLAELTGLTRAHVSTTVRELGEKNVILIRDGQYGKLLGLSKNYHNWEISGVSKSGSVPKRDPDRPETGSSGSRNGIPTPSMIPKRDPEASEDPETGSSPSRNGIIGIPKRDPEDPKTGSTKDTPKRQSQKTTPKGCEGVAARPPRSAGDDPPTALVWTAYATAYQDRYGAAPVRNQTVNGQLANFVKRIGREEAPQVAAFFVGLDDPFYVRKQHVVGAMLADAEALRTRWVTNRHSTPQAAPRSGNDAAFDEWLRAGGDA